MNHSQPLSPEFLRALGDVPRSAEAHELSSKSRDFYWYSPILDAQLRDKRAQLVVTPRNEADVITVARACHAHRVPLTPRGAGTGNYGQSVPLEGGVVIDMCAMNRIHAIMPGVAHVDAGIIMFDLDIEARKTGQQMLMYPSTGNIATLGGFIAGGHSGIGSIKNGILKDPGNVKRLRVVTVEAEPRVVELNDGDIQKVHHAYGTNGIIVEVEVALQPAVDYVHCVAAFRSYADTLRFGIAAGECALEKTLDLYLLSAVEGRIVAPYYREFEALLHGQDAMFSLVAPQDVEAFFALAALHGGKRALALNHAEMKARGLPPVIECAYNHTTLMALKRDRSVTYLQVAFPHPLKVELVEELIELFGDEVTMHHEFSRMDGHLAVFALPLVQWFDEERMKEICAEFSSRGCFIFDPHVYTIEDGGMKIIDEAQIEFKIEADPRGLMNPGKTRGWTPAVATRAAARE
jgi:FAD/FMN-containing dehydrogenase